eukprot:CAMPEP_0184559766 /NCGR_PEP_ID=MMETSP0199_2-20130426/46592_1 /TAXON_ID=1112570 /ORGANISM="Thraustochytrium sp., Strain LLF1b" /LENGTH=300 /DNA_ID=CAMNT_0026957061 /DNA_START=556 /DNA_END=1455 /DNA_ORIENTATION=-
MVEQVSASAECQDDGAREMHAEAARQASEAYHNQRSIEKSTRVVPLAGLKFNSEDLSKLGLAEGTQWSQVSEEMAVVRTKNEKARLLYLIRHGEGIHNVAEREFGKEHWESVEALTEKYFDAPLNDVGERQCAELQSSFQKATEGGMPPVDTIIVSPLTRAIETAKLGLAHIWGKVPTYAVDLCRERYGKNLCDKRKSVTELKKLHPEINFDLFMDSQEDEAFTPVRETDEAIEQRIAASTIGLPTTPLPPGARLPSLATAASWHIRYNGCRRPTIGPPIASASPSPCNPRYPNPQSIFP